MLLAFAVLDPRPNQKALTGLAARCVATHHNLMETFPGECHRLAQALRKRMTAQSRGLISNCTPLVAWAFMAVMVQLLAGTSNAKLLNLLTLHVIMKVT